MICTARTRRNDVYRLHRLPHDGQLPELPAVGAKGSARERGFVWLASYPKSGNTWLRVLLANVLAGLAGADEAVPLRALPFGMAVDSLVFGELAGMAFEDCTGDELDSLIPAFLRMHLAMSAPARRPCLLYRKVHCAYVANRAGEPLLPEDVTAGAVYVVRNPLDVAVAWALHAEEGNCAKSIGRLNRCSTLGGPETQQRRQHLLDWSSNVRSWCAAPFPVLVLRYEDMLADTVAELRRVVRFLGLEDVSEAGLRRAVAHASFANLRQSEEREGFDEKPWGNAGFFFREGRAGGWRQHLSAGQAREVASMHRATMEAFGYDPGSVLGQGNH